MGVPLPKRYNPVPVTIQLMTTQVVGSTSLDPDYLEPVGAVDKQFGVAKELEAQVRYTRKDQLSRSRTGDVEDSDGHLTFTYQYLVDNGLDPLGVGDKIKKGDKIVSLAGYPVEYRVKEVRPGGHLRTAGTKPILVLVWFEENKDEKVVVR